MPVPHRSPARLRAVAVVALLTAATAVAFAPPAAAEAPTAGRYFASTPQRVVDSRAGGTPIGPGQTRLIDLAGRVGPQVAAVVLNLTAVNSTTASYLTMWPADAAQRPTASNLQTAPGETRAVSVTVAVQNSGTSRLVKLYNNSGSTDYVVDLFGYYTNSLEAGTEGASFYPLDTPQRLLDTRTSGGALSNGAFRDVQADAVLDGAEKTGTVAVAVNITAVAPQGGGYLTAWAGSTSAPVVSTVNFPTGRTVANFAVVPVTCLESGCSSYAFRIRNASKGVQVVVDLLGFYGSAFQGGGGFWNNVTPYRVIDTRVPIPSGFGPLGPKQSNEALVGGIGSHSFMAVNATVTALKPTASTYLSVQPAAAGAPTTSTVNVPAGLLLSNATQVGTSYRSAFVKVSNDSGTTNVLLDVNGGFITDAAD